MDGFQIFSNAKSVALSYIKSVDLPNYENLIANTSLRRTISQNFITNGVNAVILRITTAPSARKCVLELKVISAFGAIE
jgi:hypothetical protein